jgi:hypothetical protein
VVWLAAEFVEVHGKRRKEEGFANSSCRRLSWCWKNSYVQVVGESSRRKRWLGLALKWEALEPFEMHTKYLGDFVRKT